MNTRTKNFLIWGAVAVIVFVGIYILTAGNGGPNLDAFAQCLKDKGATFYGAFWCPHCHNQKAMFGNSAKFLPYVECSKPDGTPPQLQICTDHGVKGYPTWIFADGSRENGEVPLATLATKTNCELPAQ